MTINSNLERGRACGPFSFLLLSSVCVDHQHQRPRPSSSGRVRRPSSSGFECAPHAPAPVIQTAGITPATRPRPSVFRCGGHMSGSARRARCPPSSGHGAASVFQTAGDQSPPCPATIWTRPHAPRPSRRQGTTRPGDALMVGIPAVRLRF